MLRSLARQVEGAMTGIPGVVDLSMEQQTDIPTVRVRVRPEDAAATACSRAKSPQRFRRPLWGPR